MGPSRSPGRHEDRVRPAALQVAPPDSDSTSCIGAPASAYGRARLLLLPKRPLPSREGKHRDPGGQLAWSCCDEGPQTRASNTRRSFSPGSGGRKSEAPGKGGRAGGPGGGSFCPWQLQASLGSWARAAALCLHPHPGCPLSVFLLFLRAPSAQCDRILLLLFLVFTYLAAPDPSCGTIASSVAAFGLSCGMWDPVP